MKKCLIMAFASLFMFGMVAVALDMDVSWGAQADIEMMFNKKIELKDSDLDADMWAQYYNVKGNVSLGDWLTISPKGGLCHMAATVDTPIGDVKLNSGCGWDIGVDVDAKVLVTEWVDLHIIGGYLFSMAGIDTVEIDGVSEDVDDTTIYLNEFEVGGVISKNLNEIGFLPNLGISIEPYVGMVYSNMLGSVETDNDTIDLSEDIAAKNCLGIRCGVKAEPIENLIVSVDTKFVDETAVAASIAYKF